MNCKAIAIFGYLDVLIRRHLLQACYHELFNPYTLRHITLLLLCLCVLASPTLMATHLVGGEISYTCLGNNAYQIKLRIYRDCNPSVTGPLDPNADIAIYDQNANLVQLISPPKGPTINVSVDATGNPCVSAPPGLCTQYAEYMDTVVLLPIPGGYTLTHQRCCRNNLDNVANSGDKGNTYTVTIPENDDQCNSTPQFTSPAPIVLCLNENINLPMSVSEPDGDSLHFELCDILNGGAAFNSSSDPCLSVIPSPPCPPPYTPIAFTPPYTSINPIPSSPQITIDPVTGVLTGRPFQIGKFVVGICVTEWRDGVPLSTVRLDYQFTVTNCILNVVSDMVTPLEDPQLLCNGLTVNFQSESKNATDLLWDFGDPSITTDTSSSSTPTYTFPAPGKYVVTLIANPGLQCGDTLQVIFDVKDPIVPQFQMSGVFCFEAQDVKFSPAGTYPPNVTYRWNFGADANFEVVNAENPPSISWDSPGKHYVELSIIRNGCTFTTRDSVQIDALTLGVNAGPDQVIRRGDMFSVSASGGVGYYWYSDHAVDFGNHFGRHTTVRLREEADTVKLYVRATDFLGCQGIDSLMVYVRERGGPINFFSPNGDGVNDFFDISDLNPEKMCRLVILNRWGSEVFTASEYENNWDGSDPSGNPLPDGTYYYILQCNQAVRHQDAVTIIRSDR